MTSERESSSRFACRSAASLMRGEMRTVSTVSVSGIREEGSVYYIVYTMYIRCIYRVFSGNL